LGGLWSFYLLQGKIISSFSRKNLPTQQKRGFERLLGVSQFSVKKGWEEEKPRGCSAPPLNLN
jgi:hypothetical protein